MVTEGLTPTLPLTTKDANGYNGDMMGGSWVWVLLIFLLLGGRGLGGFGNDGVAASPATNLINNDFLYTQQKIDNLNQAVSERLCDGFGDVRMGIQDLGYRLADCCCSINRNIDQVRFENARNTCDITTAIGASTQAIKDLINGNTMQDLRDDRERWREMYSQANQTNAITGYVTQAINQRFPYPAPANVVGFGYPGFGTPYAPFGGYGHGLPFHGFDGHKGHCDPCCC